MALTPATIPALLERHGLAPSRALGQNFLADPNTADRIVRLAGVGAGDRVVEIGPGIGSLTTALLDAGADVTAIELDRHVVPALLEVVGPDAIRLVQADALTVDLTGVFGPDPEPPWAVVSNLPYNVATPIVVRLLEEAPWVTSLLVMVQREVGERLAAGPGTKAYGAVSVKVAYFAAAKVVGIVPPTVFLPAPRVESALVRMVRHERPPVAVPSEAALFALVRAGFAQRRKMLRGALKAELGDRTEGVLAAAAVDGRRRAETLTLEDWARLARSAA
ncbi:MAG: 16S rRNA (adenine(1518)-N(6)/adenine(1519)-N(6))-dimethyltransferase RsmA [Acidimicrobiia bacterium]